MTEIVMRTRSVTKRYGSFAAVEGLSVQVKKGDIFALVGQNGAGKTTLLKLICGLTPPSSGDIELFGGSSLKALGRARGRIGSMIETPGFFPYLSARQNLEYYRIQRGIAERGCVERALRLVGLQDAGKKKYKSFSLGMKQRLGLALAILNGPELLVLDEPINGLDPVGIREFREILTRLNREGGTTVLISSHILGELSRIATEYGFIRNGRLIECASAPELERKCRVSLRLEVDDPRKAADLLRDRLSIGQAEIEDGKTIELPGEIEHPEAAGKVLVENGVMVSEVVRAGKNLETYFVDLIGGEKIA